ncbi:unnamed protein product [Microthlaspi erraticum]|uniref:Late embryogenesis abundant protein LEA-2 subgroup domain-containing protein n=1 Tax=Microthlaspi erraticum TaxID=1685480 RepID=A0A6D2JCN5_9BRAS|nr:unnamed protein product [Microthlaspi erraticum]CAA7061119.1 unnamed protein product [Microthlaspi erraticum]
METSGRRQASTTASEVTPACWCGCYSCWTIVFILVPLYYIVLDNLQREGCYVELFAHSVSVSNSSTNANVSTADWRIRLVAKSPLTGCHISLHTIQSRLLRGGQVISEVSPPLYGLEQLVTYEKTDESSTTLDFKTVVTPGVIGSVVWDYRVETVAGLKLDTGHGFLTVFCGDIPVIFTADPAGNMVGSLLGSMRRCDYLIRDNLNLPDHA